ncbi:MAG: CotH kinase family protein [Myxococcaceae bacterium]|nr:CotH kinase family protein [Myxococcaceae bacterium]
MPLKLPERANPEWLLKQLEAVSLKKLPGTSEAGRVARQANDPKSGDALLRGDEISKGLFEQLLAANGETGGEVTLKKADGTLTKAGELLTRIDLAKATRDGWFEVPKKGAVLYADFRDVDMGFFRGNDAKGQPIHVTGVPSSSLSVYWAASGPQHYVPPSNDLGVLYFERGKSVDLKRSGNTSINDPAASFKSELKAPDESDVPEDFKAKNLNRDPSMVRRDLSSAFFRETLKVPAQRYAPVKWFSNGWYQGVRDLEEPLDKTMWSSAVKSIDPKRDVPKDVYIFKAQWSWGEKSLAGGHLDKADLKFKGDGSANQYRVRDGGMQTYDLETGKKKADEAYDELAKLISVVNGKGLEDEAGNAISDTDPKRFNTPAFRKAMEAKMDVYEVLRAYAGLVMTGAWDNLINPSNFAWVAEKGKSGDAKWSALPIDLDSTWGIQWDGQPAWQDLDVLLRNGPTENVPVIWKNLLANDHFKAYALDFMEHLMKTEFTPSKIGAKVDTFWARKSEAAYLEADTPTGAPHTQRTYTNDELYKHNKENWTIRKNGLNAIAIREFVEWRRASATWQINQIRKDFHVKSGVDFAGGKVEP